MAKNKQKTESVKENEIVKYIVIEKFKDLQDHQYIYEIGEEFPRVGLQVTPERIEELASSNNLTKKVLIKKEVIKTEENDEENTETDKEDNGENTETEKEDNGESIETEKEKSE